MRIKELERLYGIKQGGSGFYGNQYTEILESENYLKTPKTQEQLAKDMGMTVQNLQNYKLLADMIPELDELEQMEWIFCSVQIFYPSIPFCLSGTVSHSHPNHT